MTKHVFIIYGEPETGKSLLGRLLDQKRCYLIDDYFLQPSAASLLRRIVIAEEINLDFVIITNDKIAVEDLIDHLKDLKDVDISVLDCKRGK